MNRVKTMLLLVLLGLVAPACDRTAGNSSAKSPSATTGKGSKGNQPNAAGTNATVAAPDGESIRFATFNASLYRDKAGQLISELEGGQLEQARRIAAILRTVRPDVVLLNEFDHDEEGKAVRIFCEQYLNVAGEGGEPLEYLHRFTAPVNTGVDSGMDLNQDGKVALPDDGFGFGRHPGQYGMVVLSRLPFDPGQVRTFQEFLWKDLPEANLPINPQNNQPWYPAEVQDKLRLSSKSHWDVPIQAGQGIIHFLVCHPTPPVFDGPEDRNGCRNQDEILFWAGYISNPTGPFRDDQGKTGGLPTDSRFVIAGDLNADPQDGDSRGAPTQKLLEHPLVRDPHPTSEGAVEAAEKQAGANRKHKGPAAEDTGDFNDRNPGNLRIDYVLPSANLPVTGGGVFWPRIGEPGQAWIGATDHRLVWLDLKQDPQP